MDCTQITNADLLVHYFRENDERNVTRVLTCFYNEYFEDISNFLKLRYCKGNSKLKHLEDDLSKEAFSEALTDFYFYLRNKGFRDDGATIKTLFTTFCRNKLLKMIVKINNGPGVPTDKVPDLASLDSEASKAEREWEDHVFKTRQKALSMLDQRCANLLRWRKVEKLSNDEIARRMDTLKPESVNNEVYRCVLKLNKLADSLLQGN